MGFGQQADSSRFAFRLNRNDKGGSGQGDEGGGQKRDSRRRLSLRGRRRGFRVMAGKVKGGGQECPPYRALRMREADSSRFAFRLSRDHKRESGGGIDGMLWIYVSRRAAFLPLLAPRTREKWGTHGFVATCGESQRRRTGGSALQGLGGVVRLGHECWWRPSGTYFVLLAPALTRWANEWRRFAAGTLFVPAVLPLVMLRVACRCWLRSLPLLAQGTREEWGTRKSQRQRAGAPAPHGFRAGSTSGFLSLRVSAQSE